MTRARNLRVDADFAEVYSLAKPGPAPELG